MLLLSGCSTIECNANASIEGSISSDGRSEVSAKAGGRCTMGYQVEAGFFNRIKSIVYAFSQQTIYDFDFSALAIDVTASNAYFYNQSGQLTVRLLDNNTVIAQRNFDYNLISNQIKLAHPDMVKNWAASYEGLATTVDYNVTELKGNAGSGSVGVTQTSRYGAQVLATATSHTVIEDVCITCVVK